ncbi:hypothetical protein E2C01_063265 [Portunus trituberculatus]|uniref:Uncharacterized protein n=1 Tax=Portunus trituberculatus TaxID=210409 RepID=A0A5B7HD78_PORTR|nr:hypothetical protein [Portunus trituberculatus]
MVLVWTFPIGAVFSTHTSPMLPPTASLPPVSLKGRSHSPLTPLGWMVWLRLWLSHFKKTIGEVPGYRCNPNKAIAGGCRIRNDLPFETLHPFCVHQGESICTVPADQETGF